MNITVCTGICSRRRAGRCSRRNIRRNGFGRRRLEDRTIDRLRLGEMQPERDHSFAGEHLQGGEAHGRQWRSAEDGGYFSFVMKVDSVSGQYVDL